MKAEIISVGTELLLGHTVNSDAAHVARELAAFGIDLEHVQTVGDNAARLEAALREALSRSSLVVCTGGLGPTDDDLTKETVARVAGLPLVEDAASLARLREYFGTRPMGENQLKQALLPAGAEAFPNSVGTAPGCAVPVGADKFVLLLPGPPSELLPMLAGSVRPFLERRTGEVIVSTMIRTFGIGEGAAAERISDLMQGSNPTAATYATDGEMFVRVTAKGASEAEARALAAPLVGAVCERLGDVVYGVDVPSLEAVVVAGLTDAGLHLVTAESCTGGLLAKRITDQPGASAVFETGLVTYANSTKTRLLGVPEEVLAAHGAVSPQTASWMADGARLRQGGDLGIGITGIAGPDGGTPEKPVGLVYIALSAPDGIWLRVMRPQGRYLGRNWTRQRAASHALDLVRRRLAALPMEAERRENIGARAPDGA
ncbi:MAG: competence/damage-inducible protein A [Desulfovibrio sp.]|uniref:competence/damage-inducible protein A n=1 Tax=Desulfovibrio sp. TaxID=885 RepID=UPI001A6CED92|nr:competence/damage-inducible protein A [Desulfovibrio sp.]MBD5417538.1 competence/damage-inducible protein A [Desulfovibrio sp.]